MNPYAFPNLLHPSLQPDYRTLEGSYQRAGQDYSMSCTIYRLVCIVEGFYSNADRRAERPVMTAQS
jgi:hypothetical protein